MSYKSNITEYRSCTKCKVLLTKQNIDYCSNCKYKLSSTKSITAPKYRIFMAKFDGKNNKNIKSYINDYSRYESGMLISIIPII
jgi:hypothetical protein